MAISNSLTPHFKYSFPCLLSLLVIHSWSSPLCNFHACSHLQPQLKFMTPPQCLGLLGWRPSQDRNELIVTLRLLLSISELSTAVDRRCPGLPPWITGAHHQETKQITFSQMCSPELKQVQLKYPTCKWNSGLDIMIKMSPRPLTDVKRSKVQQCMKFMQWSRWSLTARLWVWHSLTLVSHKKQS